MNSDNAKQFRHPVHRIAFITLAASLCLFPWLHGAELLWEQLFFCGVIFATLLLSVVTWQPQLNTTLPLKIASTCLFIWLVLMSLYLIPLPAHWVEHIAPATFQWHAINGGRTYLPLSLYPQISLIEVIKYASLAALFVSVYRVCDSLQKVRALLFILVLSATVTALYSLLNFASGGAFELSKAIPPWNLGWDEGVRGTFSYKNQYALYLVMSLSIAVGLLVDFGRRAHQHHGKRSNAFIFIKPKNLSLLICIAILLFTLLNTSSRGALVSMVLATSCIVGVAFLINKRFRRLVFKPKIIGMGALALCVAMAVFSQTSVFKRFTESRFADNGRIMLHQTALEVISEFGPAGTGPGTYPFVQHHFKDPRLGNSAMSKRAHNDYLETIATQGYIGAFFLLCILLSLAYGTVRRRDDKISLVRYGVHTGLLAYLVQSSFDVNISAFYLPAFFVVLLAIGNRLTSARITGSSNQKVGSGVGR